MEEPDPLQQVVAGLHQATFDDTHWPQASRLIDETCGSEGNFLVTGDNSADGSVQITLARFYYHGQRHEEWEQRYFQFLYKIDERIPRLRQLPLRKLVSIRSLYSESERKNSPVYCSEMPRAQTENGLNMRMDLPHSARITWQFANPINGTKWSSQQVTTINQLMPHVTHFVRVRRALIEAQALGQFSEALLENNRVGIVYLDRRGQIASANETALLELRTNHGLVDAEGFLKATKARENKLLQSLILRAIPVLGSVGDGGSIRLSRPVPLSPLVVHVIPAAFPESDMFTSGIATVVLFLNSMGQRHIDPAVVTDVLGLTSAEGEVAALIGQGMSPRQVAGASRRSEGTVRWHLHRIYTKLNIKGQAELAGLVAACIGLKGVTRQSE